MRLIKTAARIVETASRVRVASAAAHPEAALFASLACYFHQLTGRRAQPLCLVLASR